MKKAATFMVERVALRGGYVWAVSEISPRAGARSRRVRRRSGCRPPRRWWPRRCSTRTTRRVTAYYARAPERRSTRSCSASTRSAAALLRGLRPRGHALLVRSPRVALHLRLRRIPPLLRERHLRRSRDVGHGRDAPALLQHDARARLPRAAPEGAGLRARLSVPNGAWPQRYPLRDEYGAEDSPTTRPTTR